MNCDFSRPQGGIGIRHFILESGEKKKSKKSC
jgi:hypothetical protein